MTRLSRLNLCTIMWRHHSVTLNLANLSQSYTDLRIKQFTLFTNRAIYTNYIYTINHLANCRVAESSI